MLERAGANDEGAVGYGIGEGFRDSCVLEEIFGADGRLRLAPVGLIGSDDGEACEAEVGHGARGCSYIEGIARRDEDDFNAIALVVSGQDAILGQIRSERLDWQRRGI